MTVTWERNVSEVVWESQTAPGITWTTVVGGTVTGGSGPFEETVDNDDNPVILSTVDEAPFVVHPRGYSSSGDGPFHREGLLDPLTDGVDGQEIGDTYSNEAGTYRRTGSGDTDYEMVGAGGGAAVHKIDAFGFTGNNEPMASGGLTVYSSFAPGYPTLTLTVAEGSKVLMLNVSNGSCSLWTAHAASPWVLADMTGWAAQDELQARIPALRGRLITANYGGGPILVPEWDQAAYTQAMIDRALEPVTADLAITPPPPMPAGSLALHSTGGINERWVSVDGAGDPLTPLPATESIEIIVHGIPRKLPDGTSLPSFGEWATYNAPDDDPGADAQELATKYTELDGSSQETDVPGRLLMFWEWMWAGESIEDTHRMHVDIGMRQDFPSYFRLWMDATTGYMSISVLANEGVDLIEAQGRLWKVIADQTVPPAGRVLHNPNSPLWLMTSCPGDAYTIERWHDGTKVCDVDASLLDEAAQDFVDQVGQRWMSEDGSVQPVSAIDAMPYGVPAGGVLSGNLPNPGFAVNMATQAELDAAVTALVGGAPGTGDTLGELHSRLAIIEAIGSLATDAELVAAVLALIGTADGSGDTLGELQALINARQPSSTKLTALAAQTWAADKLTYQTGTGTIGETDLTSFARSLLAATTAAAARAVLGQTWQQIVDTTLGSAAASMSATITGYRAIRFRFHGRSERTGSANDGLLARINSDSGLNYSTQAAALAASLNLGLIASSLTNTDRISQITGELTLGSSTYTIGHSNSSHMNSNATVTSAASTASQMWNGSVSNAPTSFSIFTNSGSNLAAGSRLIVEGII